MTPPQKQFSLNRAASKKQFPISWFAISLLLNVAAGTLLIVLLFRPLNRPETSVPLERPVRPAALPVETAPATTASRPPTTAIGGVEQWIQTLRDAGVPDSIIATVALGDFENRWQKRFREFERKFRRGDLDEDAIPQMIDQREVEQERALRAALGDEGFRAWDQERVLREFDVENVNLSPTEATALYDLRKGLDQQRRELTAARERGDLDEGNLEKEAEALTVEYERQMKALLGPERQTALIAAGDSAAGDLRRQLRPLNLQDEKVQTMLTVQQRWMDQRDSINRRVQEGQLPPEEVDQQFKALESSREQEYRELLGADGYAEFLKAQDDRYLTMKRNSSAWGLSDTDINNLYSAIQFYESNVRDYQRRARTVEEQGQFVDWDGVHNTLAEFSRQNEETLRKFLGDERYGKLKRREVFAVKE